MNRDKIELSKAKGRTKKFVVIYKAPVGAEWKTASSTPEEMEEGMKAWMAWSQKCGDKLVDFGTPLGKAVTLGPDGSVDNNESKVMGYSILQADSMDEAKELLQDHPHLGWNATCEIVVHEALPAPGSTE